MHTDTINLVRLKQLAIKYLDQDSAFRHLLLAEPDEVPFQEGVIKLMVYSRLFEFELKKM